MRLVLFSILILACKDTASDTHEAVTQHTWFKKPTQIEAQLSEWGISINYTDRELYFVTLGMLYGATKTATQETYLHDKPNITYLLALNNVSHWISEELIDKQEALENKNSAGVFMFKGAGLPAATGKCDVDSGNNYCFADNNRDTWCDCDDAMKIGRYSGDAVPVPDTAAERKRIMHNMQDIGEFLGITLDNCTTSPDTAKYQHMPQYLLDAVFLPTFKDDSNQGVEREKAAWRRVIHAMLLGGEFFMNIDTRRKKPCQ